MKAIGKDFVREVKNTRSRFFSILILVALAVAFLSGLRATAPDMKLTLDDYLDSQDFMDVQVLSTLGVTDEDLEYLNALDSVERCEGAWLVDAVASEQDFELVVKLWSLPEEINRPVLREGRLPVAPDEVAIEMIVAEKMDLETGDVITLTPGGDFEDALRCTEFTVVGKVSSPYYISVERGTSTIGTGSCGGYFYLDRSAFDMEYYTTAFIKLTGAAELDAFYDEYEDFVDAAIDELEPHADLRAQNRYDSIMSEANEKLDDAQKELDDARADAEKELNDAADELADARRELDDGWKEYYDGIAELEDARVELADGEKELADGKKKLEDGKRELADAQIEYDDGAAELEDGRKELADARHELDDGWKEYCDGAAELEDGRRELEDGRKELEDGRREFEDGRRELEEAKETFEKEKAEAEAKLADALAKLNDGEKEYAEGLEEYESGLRSYNRGRSKLSAGAKELNEGEAQINEQENFLNQSEAAIYQGIDAMAAYMGTSPAAIISGLRAGLIPDTGNILGNLRQIEEGRQQLEAGRRQIEEGRAELSAGRRKLNSGKAELDDAKQELADARLELDDGWKEYYDGVAEFEKEIADAEAEIADAEAELADAEAEIADGEAELADAEAEIADAEIELADAFKELTDGEAEYADGEKELADGEAELADAAQKLADARVELADAEKEVRDAEKKIRDGKTEIADGEVELADAYIELTDGEQEYADGLTEYEDGKKEADEKIGDAEKELADARSELSDIEECTWYVLGRETNPGYLGFGQDADRMANLAKVFPVLFFLVAALVCLTTMTRMVEEQRTQIGCLKALGYRSLRISMKYIAYGAVPAVFGGLLGLCIGYTLFPKMIFTAYQIMYDVPDLGLRQYTATSVSSVLAAVATTTLSTLWACLSTLKEVPAQLMRPRTPKSGKRVILEYIKPVWKRMSFFAKVTTRNLFRYQKRFWMTVIGIGGCTALIIAGFGLRSSLLETMSRQYGEIYDYHAQITVENNMLPEERAALENYTEGHSDIRRTVPARLVTSTAESDSYSVIAFIEAAGPQDLADFVLLKDYRTGEILTLDDSGVIIDQKLSELLDVDVGDSFIMDNDGFFEVTVAGITEHYLGHYVYMTPAYYETVFGSECDINTYFLRFSSNDQELCSSIFSDMMSLDGVSAATRIEDTRDTYQHSMERIDFVVVIVILSAAALAVIVLYNLSNINITERRRELATIKVLGFYDLEVSQYIYRENIVLTIAGIALGLVFGRILHTWLIKSVEIEIMMFGRDTDPMALVWASVLTVIFSFVVNIMAHRKMKKIDMVESLKSAE